jgi:hypothetical protein
VLDVKLAAREEVGSCLVEHKAEAAGIDAAPAGADDVEKLYLLVVIDAELQPLRHVVHLGGNNGVRVLKLKLREDLQQ